MKILGIGSPFGHDASAALLVDGKIVAAAEEERFIRKKHAIAQRPINAINYCLKVACLKPRDIDIVAYPWSYYALRQKRLEYLCRTIFTNTSRAYKKFLRNKRELNNQQRFIGQILSETGFDLCNTKIGWVEHHLAHVASCFYLSGLDKAALMSIDGGGEITATLLGLGQGNSIKKIKEIIAPDSLGNFYSTMTDYLGFEREDGEYKVMGMAPYGIAKKINFNHIIWWDDKRKTYRCNDNYVWVRRKKRVRMDKVYSKRMVDEFGPERSGDGLSEPYIHIAAVTQDKLEEMALNLVENYLKQELIKNRTLCFSGGCALNVSLNRKLLEYPLIDNLWIQPASHDAGTSLGAAVYVAANMGERILPMKEVYLGPEFSNREIEEVFEGSGFDFEYVNDIAERVAELIYEGKIVGWFQGRMEWGPRALGDRSILGNPTIKGTADKINAAIKFREKWRPFCPSILKEFGAEILGSTHPAPFMTIAFKVSPAWRKRIPEVVHVDGTCRPQLVDKEINPKFYKVIESFYHKTGVPLLINTSLNRRGEPIVCTPTDALKMFKGSGLDYLAIGDLLVSKKFSKQTSREKIKIESADDKQEGPSDNHVNVGDLVSVIIPTYNRASLISRAIESVINQTYRNIELIIVDDCSEDNTPEIVSNYLNKDKRIIYIRNSKNQGAAYSLNVGIEHSRGNFLMFLDSDCEYLPGKIDEQISLMRSLSFQPSIIYSNIWVEAIKGKTAVSLNLKNKFLTLDDYFSCRYSILEPSTWFCKRDIFKKYSGFDINYYSYVDMDFLMRIVLGGERIYFLNKPLGIKHNVEGISSISFKFISQKEKFLNKHFCKIKKYRKFLSNFYYRLGKDLLRLGDFKIANSYFLRAFIIYPFRLEYLLKIIYLSFVRSKASYLKFKNINN